MLGYWWAGRLSALLILDAALQSTYAGPVVFRCNFCFVVRTLPSRSFSKCIIFFLGLLLHLLGCLTVRILRFVLLDASFELLCSHPSRCSDMCILRDALMCASFEMFWCVHPSRCFDVCILRDALMCASLEMLRSHPSGCSDMCILRGALLHLVKMLPVFFGFVSGVRTRGVKCERNF